MWAGVGPWGLVKGLVIDTDKLRNLRHASRTADNTQCMDGFAGGAFLDDLSQVADNAFIVAQVASTIEVVEGRDLNCLLAGCRPSFIFLHIISRQFKQMRRCISHTL